MVVDFLSRVRRKVRHTLLRPRTAIDRVRPDDYVRLCFQMILGRPPEPGAVPFYRDLLRRGMPRWQLAWIFLESDELRYRLRGQHPSETLHRARMLWVKSLPAADVVVDLGGASDVAAEGALFAMGYPHRPSKVIIVDLPPHRRHLRPTIQHRRVVRAGTTTVEYIDGPMHELGMIADASADLVFSGESIEHVSEAHADDVIADAFRILRPGGRFCLDTPNGRLTRLESPGKLTHPEHHKEYYQRELREKLGAAGFSIEESGGICPMPNCIASGKFTHDEMIENETLGPDGDICYLLSFRCRKP